LDAEEESETLMTIPKIGGGIEHQLILSPARYGINIFRRQIVRIGDATGPFELHELKKLHPDDFALLQNAAEKLDSACAAKNASQAVTQRGRTGEGNSSS